MATATHEVDADLVTLEIDSAHSAIAFAIKHMMIATVRGEFGAVTGQVLLDPHDVSRSRGSRSRSCTRAASSASASACSSSGWPR